MLDSFLLGQRFNDSSSWFHSWDIQWRADIFRRLSYAKLAIQETMSKEVGGNMLVLGLDRSNCKLELDEVEDWKALQARGLGLSAKFASLIESYVHEATIQESRSSNSQAQSLGRLTSLATVLVPISITAGIFSMGGDFLVGEPRFWVFWAVAVPVATPAWQ